MVGAFLPTSLFSLRFPLLSRVAKFAECTQLDHHHDGSHCVCGGVGGDGGGDGGGGCICIVCFKRLIRLPTSEET